MFEHLFYILLAILGLGFLVFIHELGHFWMARREGMTVEVFSIGLGRPLYSWIKNGVRWQVGYLPFGGYVKIAGMQREGNLEAHEIKDGFYSKSPMQRIRVALMGPAVNIAFALLAFAVLWLGGGRDKSFAEFTHRIGFVDPKSALYDQGVRPGDVIESYGGRSFDGSKDLMLASVMSGDSTEIKGYKIDYLSGARTDFDYTLSTYDNPNIPQQKMHTIGVLTPAQYLILEDQMPGFFNVEQPGSPMYASGIQKGDRLVWADGEMLFSTQQLSSVINESTAFLTVLRGDSVFQTKVPRVHLDELKLSAVERAEFDDWQHETGLKGRVQDLFFIPYLLSPSGSVEMRLDFIDVADQEKAFERCLRCSYFHPLEEGDQILAIGGQPVASSYDLLNQLQSRHVLAIVQRDPAAIRKVLWTQADKDFDQYLDPKDLQAIVASIGSEHPVKEAGHLVLLNPVVPKTFSELPRPAEQKASLAQEFAQKKKEIEALPDPQKREEAMSDLMKSDHRKYLGILFKDRQVVYNPTPWKQFASVSDETWRTLSGLFSGNLSPKYMSGPVGIVQAVHYGWTLGFKEALFWMAVISLNLGIFNLLPLPVLDGGHIMFSIYEGVSKRRVSSKAMERLIFPFFGLLIAFFIYVTYQDLSRLFTNLF